MKGIIKTLGVSLLSLSFVTACSYNPFIANNHTTGNPAATGIGAGLAAGGAAVLLRAHGPTIALAGLGGAALGYYFTTLRFDAGSIIQAGGQVFKLGDRIGIYIPNDSLFEPNTDVFLPQAKPVLDSTIDILSRFPDNNIFISGNSSGFSRERWEKTLSEKRARQVSAYLWFYGVNRFKTTTGYRRELNYAGYGDYFHIANDYSNLGIRTNNNIQITSYPSYEDLGLKKKPVPMHDIRNSESPLYKDTTYTMVDRPCGKGDINKCFKE